MEGQELQSQGFQVGPQKASRLEAGQNAYRSNSYVRYHCELEPKVAAKAEGKPVQGV